MIPKPLITLSALALVSACVPGGGPGGADGLALSRPIMAQVVFPPNAAAGTCWAQLTNPAVIDTVTQQVQTAPAQVDPSGTVIAEATFETRTERVLVQERSTTTYETPCPPVYTPERVATLQRALAVRGFYKGAITGTLDTRTARAVQAFQRTRGMESGTLSIQNARDLGLIAYPREAFSDDQS